MSLREEPWVANFLTLCPACYEAEKLLPISDRAGALPYTEEPVLTGGERPCDFCGEQYTHAVTYNGPRLENILDRVRDGLRGDLSTHLEQP